MTYPDGAKGYLKRKYRKNNIVVEFMVKVLVVAGIVIGVIIFTLIILFVNSVKKDLPPKSDSIKTQKEYYDAVGTHLEEKYGKKFIVNPKGTDGGGGPIPFSQGCYTMTYEAYAEEDPNFIFFVDVIPKSIENNNISEIRDNYCWKFLKKKLKNNIKENLEVNLSEDYKLLINLSNGVTFENYLNSDSIMEDYFRSNSLKPIIYIYVFTIESGEDLEVKTEQYMSLFLNEIKAKSKSVKIKFTYYAIQNREDFEAINVMKEEKSNLMLYRNNIEATFKPIKYIKKEKKIELVIDTDDL
ncbi:hypothetical protein [Clostridium sp. E02]|uniref:hypothetical protein n=1 Tax=Clostridium sp. E02 TaxID=2487134 RepID=UPI000F540CF9|nr:hypothetical protein [Clostridium sp. E02]